MRSEAAPRFPDYWLFGLRVRSTFELPELVPATNDAEPDVLIDTGAVMDTGSEGGLTAVEDALVLVVPDVARYRIDQGRWITVDAMPGVAERNVRLFLFGSAFGALLHQRGLLPLHANAVEIDGKAIAFMGASGEGKSTLAAWFHDHSYRLVADDVCVVSRSADGSARAAAGMQRLRLWKEALEASGRDPSEYKRSFEGREDLHKFDVPIEGERHGSRDYELAGLYVLNTHDCWSIDRLEGLDAAEAVFSHTYRGQFVNTVGLQRQHWQAAVHLIERVPIFRINRPRDLSLMDEQGRRIVDHVRSGVFTRT